MPPWLNAAPAPRAIGQLVRRTHARACELISPQLLDGLHAVVGLVGRGSSSNPKADSEWSQAPAVVALLQCATADHFAGTHQGTGPLELLNGETPDAMVTQPSGSRATTSKSSTISGAGYAVRGLPAASPFTVTPITANQTYYFVVSAYSGQPSCESANSSEVSAMSCVATAPAVLSATPDSAGHVVLAWTSAAGAVSYNVSRSTTSGSGYTVVASGLSTTTFTDSPVAAASGSTTYYYVVRANTGNCNSPYSPEAAAVGGDTR